MGIVADPRRGLFSFRALVLLGLLLAGGLALFLLFVVLTPQGGRGRAYSWSEIRTIEEACKMFRSDNGKFPNSLRQLLIRNQSTGFGPYLKDEQSIIDPWGKAYRYDPTAIGPEGVNRPRIWCQSRCGAGIANYQLSN